MSSRPAEPIIVWRFYDAPKELQALSGNGGDEDWLAEVPPDQDPIWMLEGSSFGCCCVETHKHPTREGWEVRIGCHA